MKTRTRKFSDGISSHQRSIESSTGNGSASCEMAGPDKTREAKMKVQCPVCGMEFSEKRIAAVVDRDGVRYYFCTQACQKQFEEDPSQFVA